ncbi:MAG: ABC transporter substrate-binding protein [Alphaproteobacteria bacterium]
MRYREFKVLLNSGSATRRDIVRALAGVGIGVATLPLARRAKAAPDIEVFTWSGYELPEFHQPFIDKHGASPNVTFFAELEEALNKLMAGYTADVGHPCASSADKWVDAGIVKPIDTSRVEQWGNIFPLMRDIPTVRRDDTSAWMMPWDWGNSSILYRSDLVDIEEESYALYLDERYKGKMSFYDSADGFVQVTGAIIGAKDVFAMTDDEFALATETMKKLQENIRFYWSDPTEIEQALAAGEIVNAYAWNASATNLKRQGVPIRFMDPKEGIWTWVCGLCLFNNGAGSEDQQYDFLNAFLDTGSGKNLIEMYGYGHANAESFKLVAQEKLDELGIGDPIAMMAKARFSRAMAPEFRQRVINAFDEIKASM